MCTYMHIPVLVIVVSKETNVYIDHRSNIATIISLYCHGGKILHCLSDQFTHDVHPSANIHNVRKITVWVHLPVAIRLNGPL